MKRFAILSRDKLYLKSEEPAININCYGSVSCNHYLQINHYCVLRESFSNRRSIIIINYAMQECGIICPVSHGHTQHVVSQSHGMDIGMVLVVIMEFVLNVIFARKPIIIIVIVHQRESVYVLQDRLLFRFEQIESRLVGSGTVMSSVISSSLNVPNNCHLI